MKDGGDPIARHCKESARRHVLPVDEPRSMGPLGGDVRCGAHRCNRGRVWAADGLSKRSGGDGGGDEHAKPDA